jgi:hypothetical protein
MLALETVEADALQRSAAERELLVERLILSLHDDPVVEEAWAAESNADLQISSVERFNSCQDRRHSQLSALGSGRSPSPGRRRYDGDGH